MHIYLAEEWNSRFDERAVLEKCQVDGYPRVCYLHGSPSDDMVLQPQPNSEQLHSVQSCSACLRSDCPLALESLQSWGEFIRNWTPLALRRLKEDTSVSQDLFAALGSGWHGIGS